MKIKTCDRLHLTTMKKNYVNLYSYLFSTLEKHKVHHQKNDRFAQDGFRRYIKCENCDFPDCQYSGVINHIHCIRPGKFRIFFNVHLANYTISIR